MRTRPFDDIITGERLQEIADVSLGTPEKFARHHSLPASARTKICPFRLTSEGFEVPEAGLARLRTSRVVFVYSEFVEIFLGALMSAMERPFVLLTHNSDHGVERRFLPALDDPRLVRWYAQNLPRDIIHPKLVSLPIGIANAMWPHGDLETLRRIAEEDLERDIPLYVNFDPDTAGEARRRVVDALAGNPLAMNPGRAPVSDYWRALRRSRFVAAPRGNGQDTHRLWEALYLGAVPIVDEADAPACVDGLPVLRTTDWGSLNAATLNRFLADLPLDAFASERLTLGWWRARITADAGSV